MASQSPLKTAYRILSWVVAAGLALILILVLKKSPAPSIPVDPAAAARVEQKFADADQLKAAGRICPSGAGSHGAEFLPGAEPAGGGILPQPEPQRRLPQPASDALAAAHGGVSLPEANGATLEEVQSSVKDVKIDMEGDLVKAYVTFDFHGKDMSLELDGHLGTQNGYIKFEPVAGKLGSLPLPQAALDSAVEKMMESPENREKLKLPADISDIQIQNGQAVVSYKGDPQP